MDYKNKNKNSLILATVGIKPNNRRERRILIALVRRLDCATAIRDKFAEIMRGGR